MSSLHEMVFTLVAEGRLSAADAHRLLDVRPEPAATDPNKAIAVIGMAGQFGDCPDLDAYWEMIAAGRHCIRPLPSGRWPGQSDVGGFLEDPSLFDPLFFKIAPNEAGLMDPQQRLFLESAYLALEDAGQTEQALAGSRCSVFVGTGSGDYGQRLEAAGVAELPQALMGNVPSILAARIAYLLDIKGPALAIDTACSSSLVAVHLACESLRRDECELAVAGGVCVINSARFVNAMSKAGVISASGRCHTFDSRADGFVCGEGSGAVVLKLLDKAQADGDRIHAVILSSGINQDGRTNGITAPSAPSQEALERSVYQRFGIDPAAIGYIETHGTGTPLGDPIEIEALIRVFSTHKHSKVLLGSVKTNIGHTLTAAGIAGILKVLLMLRAGRVPPAPDFQQENPRLGLTDTPLQVATENQIWNPGPTGQRIAAVSSFGFSGTNAHLVMAQAPFIQRPVQQPQPVALLLSSRDKPALVRRAADLAAYLRRWPDLRLDDVALTLATRRTPMAQRAVLIAQDREEALRELDQLARSEALPTPKPAGQIMTDLALAWLAGETPDAKTAFSHLESRQVSLPGYPLNRYPCHPMNTATTHTTSSNDPLESVRQVKLYSDTDPDLADNGMAFAQLEHWGCKVAAAALLTAGLFAKGRKVMTRAALRRDFAVAEQRWGLFDAILPILERVGVLVIEGDLLRIQPTQVGLSAAELQAEEQRLSVGQMQSFVEVLKRTTAALPEVLRDQVQGNAILFPEGRLDLVAAIYGGNQLADHFNTLMAQSLTALVRHRLENASRVQILEIGAGTGGATAAILPALKPFIGQIHYTYTDVSLGFLKHGRESFGDSIEPALLDITRSGEDQGFATAGYDIVIAANVLHATPDLGETLHHLWRLLAAGGTLVLNEVTAVQDFATLTFGLSEGWWAFCDGQRRLPGAPLVDVAGWRSLLDEAGFPEVLALGLNEQLTEAEQQQSVLVARRNQEPASARPLGKRSGLSGSDQIVASDPAKSDSTLSAIIQAELGQTLGLDPSLIDPSGRFMDYGVDSILGLDLVNRLNRRFELELTPTLLFEHPTVDDLATHLLDQHDLKITQPMDDTPHAEPNSVTPIQSAPEPIAVIGMAGRFAAADDLEAFHSLLAEGRSGITDASERLGVDPDNPPEHLSRAAPYLRWGGMLQNIERFDAMFFRISGREAELSDPQHRIFLTEAWRALEDAGYGDMAGADCGVFVGCHGGDYTHLMSTMGIVPDAFAFTGNAASILAARVAYILDLKGPAIAIDTACSSSLVAIHLACQALRAGECEYALAGGVFVNTTAGFNTAAASAGMLSPRGRCAAFDAEADGFVPGEGAGAVLLKPLSLAQADGDNIIAVILGSVSNQDGKTNGITAPNPASQAELIRKAHARAGVEPAQVSYIETHGTGTRLGDPIEIEGLNRAFADAKLTVGACALGSVKTNVGHAAHAAGIAGLIKTLLSFRHQELYPSLHFHKANPAIHLDQTPFVVNTQRQPWIRPQQGRRVAGVSSFGFSGTNCHVVLADPPADQTERTLPPAGALIALSARSTAALNQRRHDLARWLVANPDARLADIAYTLGCGRHHFEQRWACVVSTHQDLQAVLEHGSEQSQNHSLPESRSSALQSAAQAYLAGELPDFARLAAGGRRIPLPTYPFEERAYWLTPPETNQEPKTETSLSSSELPKMMTPVWEPSPINKPNIEGVTLCITGDLDRAAVLTQALQTLGAVVKTDLMPVPGSVQALLLIAPTNDGDTNEVLKPLFEQLRRIGKNPSVPILYVHDGSPLTAAAIAAAPSMRFICNDFSLRSIALPSAMPPLQAAEHLLTELSTSESEVMINKRGERLVRHLRTVNLSPSRGSEQGGVWLITGGLGGLGPHLARHLALGRGAKIGLLGRSPLQGDKSQMLKALRADGVNAHYVCADVTDLVALTAAIAELEAILGPIDSVIHAAGVPSQRPLAESNWNDFVATLRSKIDGTLALDRVLAERPLRAFVLFSSLAAEFGDFGQCDYAIANAFLGRFADWRTQEVAAGRRHGRTLALAWPIWEGGHSALGAQGSQLMSQALGIQALPYSTGLAIFDRAVAASDGPAEILIMSGTEDADRYTSQSDRQTVTSTAPVGSDAAAVRAELSGIIAKLLKLDPTDLQPSVSLGDFGFDSITLKEFAVILSERYGVDISPAVFFAHGSIEALSEHLCTNYPEAVQQVYADPAPQVTESQQLIPETPTDSETIAIIGMAGRFPGAQNLEEFWRNIVEGRITVSPMPMQRRQLLGLTEDQPSPQAGFIDDIEYFDPGFFRLSKREAVHMDPQHRLALEATWQALHDARVAPEALSGHPVGVFLGQQVNGYAALLRNAAPEAVAQAALGNVSALMPNRISYILDLHGPSEAIDTACSSALVAVHRAIRALRTGECELAIAGGVSLLLDINDQRSTEHLGILSADARCHSFDARANGYVKGEGVGIVVLKPLSRALADGNPIHALIRGSAVNHGGRAQSLTAPNPLAQAELIRSALTDAKVEPTSIGYIETHGTGTELGDPIEVEALKAIFGDTGEPRCALGSVKVNIGHLEPAAGIAGLIKTVLALRHGVRPLLTDLEQPNPYLKLDGAPLYLPRESTEWSLPTESRRAGVSAFGFGGSNAHVILEQAPPVLQTGEPLPELIFNRVKCWVEPSPVEHPPAVIIAEPIESKPQNATPPVPVPNAPAVSETVIREKIREIIATALYITPEELDDSAGFMDLGLDSILAVEVTSKLNQAFDTDLQATRLYDHPTVEALARHLAADRQAMGDESQDDLDPILAVLRAAVATAMGINVHSVDPSVSLDRLSVTPEQANNILASLSERYGCRLETADLSACRDLRAVARLLAARSSTQVPVVTASVTESEPVATAIDSNSTLAWIRAELAELLRLPAEAIETDLPLVELGLDPVLAQELADRLIRDDGGYAPSARELLSAPSLQALAADNSLPAESAPAPQTSAAEPAPAGPASQTVIAEPAPTCSVSQQTPIDIAVVGIACRFPGAPDKNAFWDLLREGRSGITRVPAQRWNPHDYTSGLEHPEQRSALEWGGFVDNIDRFDPLFFNLSPREAELMDPQQRLFLEEAWHAFEDAGITNTRLQGAYCGVFIGGGQGDYSRQLPMDDPAQVKGQLLLGNTSSVLAARIAYLLDLRGPAVAVDTACSSALVAADMGFRAIRDGSCELALVGGVNLMTTPQMHVMTAASGMLAPDGRCRTFDDAASGFVPGEGIGLLVLRCLDQALADGDRIYGVIRASGTNQDGKTSSITAPSSNSQETLEREVWQRFGLEPADFGYVEAHGTGTRLGDPIEIDALSRAFAASTGRRQDCPIGSVKTNIGHTLAAAGAASLIKTLLALYHGIIPPSLNFKTPNRHIDFTKTPFFVPTESLPWRERRLAAVSSFGFSGTNAHMVLAAAPEQPPPSVESGHMSCFVLSARDRLGLKRQAERVLGYLQSEQQTLSAVDVAYTLACRRSHLEYRLAILASDLKGLNTALAAFLADQAHAQLIGPTARERNPISVDPQILRHAKAGSDSDSLRTIAQLWTRGASIPWDELLGTGRFIDWPLTVFADLRCWIGSSPNNDVQTTPATSVQPPARPVSSADSLCLTLQDPVMVNHQVAGQPLLPGMASLALLHAKARQLAYAGPLSSIAWLRPITAPNAVRIATREQVDRLELELLDQNDRICATAKVKRIQRPCPPAVDISAIETSCTHTVAMETIYQRLEAGGVVHGSEFRLLEQIRAGAGHILASLRLGDPSACLPIANTELSPALFDSALQALAALQDHESRTLSEHRTLLPAAAKRLSLYAPLQGCIKAWLSVDQQASGVDRLVADLRLLNERGEVLAELLGFEARATDPEKMTAVKDDIPAAGELILMSPRWIAEKLSEEIENSVAAPLVLHGSPETEWAQALAREHGGKAIDMMALDSVALTSLLASRVGQPLVFAAWRTNDDPLTSLNSAALMAVEKHGVHALLTLFHGLVQERTPRHLILVTRRLHCVLAQDQSDPAFAALSGFARSAAREWPHLSVSCVDLPALTEERNQADGKRYRTWLLQEPSDSVVSYRNGLRLRQHLARLRFGDFERVSLPFPRDQHPVCLLIGGAGGLGQVAAQRFASQYGARIALVGRRPEDNSIRTTLATLTAAGGDALYLQADATDALALQQAIAAVRARWGHIHWAVHSAIMLRDGPVVDMMPADLDAALAPKSHGLNNLIRALADDPPDILCLFSSANAFSVNPGQANYAAGCTFVDALALATDWNVRILNWSIWGETGVVAEERYLARARQAGVIPLANAEALDVLEQSLNQTVPQIVVMKMAAAALPEFEANLQEDLEKLAPAIKLPIASGLKAMSAAFEAVQAELLTSQASAFESLIHYGREQLFRIYAQLGLARLQSVSLAAAARELGIIVERHGLFRAHLDILARSGWIRLNGPINQDDTLLQSCAELPSGPAVPLPPAAIAALPNASRLLELALANTCDILTGLSSATEVLFPGGRTDLVEGVYKDDPAAQLFNNAIGAAITGLCQGHPLNVIEIGAGAGGSTQMAITALDQVAPGSSYTYTDVSQHFVSLGEHHYSQRANTEFRLLNIAHHPSEQGFESGAFDLVIAANVLHALGDCRQAISHAKALLKPGGVLILLEATARSDFATFIFGLTDGWWACRDPERRLPHSPLLSVAGWRVLLETQGFNLAGVGQLGDSDAQSVLLSVSDGWVNTVRSSSVKAKELELETTPVAAVNTDRLETVRTIMSEVLRLPATEIDPEEPLERYGVDSLVVNDIHTRLEAEVGPLPRELVFEAVTLQALVARLDALAPVISKEPPPPVQIKPPEPESTDCESVGDAIAVIGIAGCYPGADDVTHFWDNLESAYCAIGPMPDERLALWPQTGEHYSGAYLNDVAGFDALFFNISPAEAAAMDPQERLFLETAWAALENAGRRPSAWNNQVGVFVGVMGQDYLRLAVENQAQGRNSFGDAPAWSIANRVSHVLDLNGPSLAVDTACSSSLTAIHLACESLRAGNCDAALAGGVHLVLHPASRQGLQALGMFSASGNAKPFSHDADGLVGGEGVGCLVLRRAQEAMAAGDRILGIIRATGLAANGRARNYMAPTAVGQAAGLRQFLTQHRIPAASLDYIECQAVGSNSADPLEVSGLAQTLEQAPNAVPIPLGSIKGSIGHLEAASGIAQATKVIGMLNRAVLMPTVGISELHPEIAHTVKGRFNIFRNTQAWPASLHDSAKRRALVQSFGAGGSHAFVIIEEPPQAALLASKKPVIDPSGDLVFPLSARTETALLTMLERLHEYLSQHLAALDPAGVAWTLQQGRASFEHRAVVVAPDLSTLKQALIDIIENRPGQWYKGMRRPGAGNGSDNDLQANTPHALAAHWANGHTIDWTNLWAADVSPVQLPAYPFEHRYCWLNPVKTREIPMPPLPTTRAVIVLNGPSEPEELELSEQALAAPEANEILIKVDACGLNFADLLCVRGLHPNLRDYPYMPGFEVAGTVAAVGAEVTRLQVGQTVMALTGGRGGQANYVSVPEFWASACPKGIKSVEAAATPIAYLTMSHALERAQLKNGETILIQSAAGGTGPFAVQLALAQGATVIATAGNADKLEALQWLGAHHVINYRKEDFFARCREITEGRGVDVVLNTLGGDAIQKGIDLLASGGRYVEIALAGLRSAGKVDLSALLDNQSIITINLGRLLADPVASRQALDAMSRDLASGRVRPLISKVFPIEQLADAYRHMDRRENVGKIIMSFGVQTSASVSTKPTARATLLLKQETELKSCTCVASKPLAERVRELTAQALGLAADEIAPDRPLEELGLNSISGVALMRAIHLELGIAAPVSLLYEAGSLKQLTERLKELENGVVNPASDNRITQLLLRQTDEAGELEPLVPIQSGQGIPSIWVHGAPGDVSWVTRLAEGLGPEHALYGIEARGVHGELAPRRQVSTMVRDYVSSLRRLLPQGPYRLGGYSGGGIIAFEMARELIASGARVDKLVLLDAYAPGNSALAGMDKVYGDGFIYLLAANWFGRNWGMTEPLANETLVGLSKKAQLQAALDHLYTHAQPEVERKRLSAFMQGMDRVGRAIGHAISTYEAKPLSADAAIDVLLIRSTGGMSSHGNSYGLPGFLLDADYTEGWQDLFPQALRIETIACDHFSLLDDPSRQQAATMIREFFAAKSGNGKIRQTVRAVVETEIRRVLVGLPEDAIRPKVSLAELGAHSIDRAEVATAAMEKLDVVVPLTALAQVNDIDGLVELLTDYAGRGS